MYISINMWKIYAHNIWNCSITWGYFLKHRSTYLSNSKGPQFSLPQGYQDMCIYCHNFIVILLLYFLYYKFFICKLNTHIMIKMIIETYNNHKFEKNNKFKSVYHDRNMLDR